MTTTQAAPTGAAPTAYDLALLLAAEIPRLPRYEGHFASLGTTVRCADGKVELVIDATLDYFDPACPPARFVLRVSEPELVPAEAGVEVGAPA